MFGTLEIMPLKDFRFQISDFRRKGGFSLIELLIALGIIALVAAVSIPNLRDFNRSQEIEAAASKFLSMAKTAQSSAGANIQCPDGTPTSSWQMDLSLSGGNDTYNIKANCIPAAVVTTFSSPFASTPSSVQTFSAVTDGCNPTNTNVTIFFTNNQISYQCASGAVVTTQTIKVTLSSSSGGTPKTVAIEPGGTIRLE